MSLSSVLSKLKAANVQHSTEPCNGNGFNGTRIVYPSRTAAVKAEKVMGWKSGDGHVKAYFNKWATTRY